MVMNISLGWGEKGWANAGETVWGGFSAMWEKWRVFSRREELLRVNDMLGECNCQLEFVK
jgi:hypothetical protein